MELSPRVDVAFKKVFADPKKQRPFKIFDQFHCFKRRQSEKLWNSGYCQDQTIRTRQTDHHGYKSGISYRKDIQLVDTKYYQKRVLEYWAETYSMQIGNGNDYEKLKKVIEIHILNFEMFGKEEKFHSQFTIKSDETGKRYFTDFEIHA